MERVNKSEWEDIAEYTICKCRACNKWTWYQDELEDYPEACLICGVIISEIGLQSFDKIGMTIQGESYFDVGGDLVHEASLDFETFKRL